MTTNFFLSLFDDTQQVIPVTVQMKIIYNRFLPLGSFWAINLFGVVFARKGYGRLGRVDVNHEYIHTLQQREMLFVPFYLWYVMEWGIKMVKYRNLHKAYRNISFEREAYACQHDLRYRYRRKPYAWMSYLWNRKKAP